MTAGPEERFELRTERLLLRPFSPEDVDDVYAYARDPEWGRALLLPVPEPYTRQNAEEFVSRTLRASWSTDPHFAIVLETTVIGGINLTVDKTHEIAGLGYAIARPHWGKGLAPEAATAVFDWAFAHHGLAKIYARAALRNRRSTRVMEKLGMVREGVLRSHRLGRGERVDEVHYGVLRDEWERRTETEPR